MTQTHARKADPISDLEISLTAVNSSGEQTLYLANQGDSYWFTLCGTHNEKPIQIDFDEMTRDKLEELQGQIEIILACASANQIST